MDRHMRLACPKDPVPIRFREARSVPNFSSGPVLLEDTWFAEGKWKNPILVGAAGSIFRWEVAQDCQGASAEAAGSLLPGQRGSAERAVGFAFCSRAFRLAVVYIMDDSLFLLFAFSV